MPQTRIGKGCIGQADKVTKHDERLIVSHCYSTDEEKRVTIKKRKKIKIVRKKSTKPKKKNLK